MKTLHELKAKCNSTSAECNSILLNVSGYSFHEFDKAWFKEFVDEYEQRTHLIVAGLDEPTKADQFIAMILDDCY